MFFFLVCLSLVPLSSFDSRICSWVFLLILLVCLFPVYLTGEIFDTGAIVAFFSTVIGTVVPEDVDVAELANGDSNEFEDCKEFEYEDVDVDCIFDDGEVGVDDASVVPLSIGEFVITEVFNPLNAGFRTGLTLSHRWYYNNHYWNLPREYNRCEIVIYKEGRFG